MPFAAVAVWVPDVLLGPALMFFVFLGVTLCLFGAPQTVPIMAQMPL